MSPSFRRAFRHLHDRGFPNLTTGPNFGEQYTVTATTPSAENLKTATWRLAVDLPLETETMASPLHAAEQVPSEGRGRPAQFISVRFVFWNKLTKDDRLLVGFDALVLAEVLGRDVNVGKIIHGDNHAILKVKVATLLETVSKLTSKVSEMLSAGSPPDLMLNRHCGECEFLDGCRQKALEKDDLSLLAGMSEKERKKYHSKGIFTVTQLSYIFRPRRRPKRLRDKREKYHHSLKALAIREKKIHIVGTPEVKIDGTPVYLDVEGLPDRDFYYLIGVRIGNGESAVQHSLWADTAEDEGRIWREFLDILGTVEKPVLIYYGSYETSFLKQMKERHDTPHDSSLAAKAISSALNLVSVMFARIYFPTFSNGLKEIARYLGFDWSSASASGVQTIVWRETWSGHRESPEKQGLICYNAEDCEALELVTQELLGLHEPHSGSRGTSGRDVIDTVALKREHPYGFKRNTFFFPELDVINKSAYWDYQRENVYVKSNRRLRHVLKRAKRSAGKLAPNKRIQCPSSATCPRCGSSDIYKHGRAKKIVYDLKFTRGGLKRWIVRYDFHRYLCRSCQKGFHPRERDWSGSKFGPALLAYSVYQNIELRLPQETIDQCTAPRNWDQWLS